MLAVYPPGGQPDGGKPVGHVRVVATSPLIASVVPTAYADLPVIEKLPVDGRCEIVQVDYGEMRLHVALAPSQSPEVGSARGRIVRSLQQFVAEETSLFSFVTDPAKCNGSYM